jgi:replicative DNA helicase
MRRHEESPRALGAFSDNNIAGGRYRDDTAHEGHGPSAVWGSLNAAVDVAETGLLGAALLSAEAATAIVAELSADDFGREAHRIVFDAVAALVAAGVPVDTVTLTDRLARDGQLDEVGGATALSLLLDPLTCPSPAAWPVYARIVLRGSRTRRVRSALARAIRRIDDGHDVEQVASEVALAVAP